MLIDIITELVVESIILHIVYTHKWNCSIGNMHIGNMHSTKNREAQKTLTVYLVLTLAFTGRGSRPSVMTTGGSRPTKSIPGPTVAPTIGVPTNVSCTVTLSLTTADKFVGKRAAFS